MRLLLDTHALLWALSDSPRLARHARSLIEDPVNEKIVSAVSSFEITTKYRLGKLPEAEPLLPDFAAALSSYDFTSLSITSEHAARAGALPFAHGDPFDRLLIAQSMLEGMPLVSNEVLFDGFGVQRLW